MTVSKMDHAMLSFGLMGSLLVPRPAETVKRPGILASLLKPATPPRRK